MHNYTARHFLLELLLFLSGWLVSVQHLSAVLKIIGVIISKCEIQTFLWYLDVGLKLLFF